ncbi:MAG: energy-coupled thiamine transporter ThiT [Coriobacteriales bacterium]|jgi:thiamine transporter ThiT|nr:energy-coupled thiamine transporter ThiT [Coriobacteriales bacterium]
MRSSRIIMLVEMALAVALAVVFNFLVFFKMPMGGSVTLVMLPIAVVALRRGALAGAVVGALYGLIDLLIDPYILFPMQVLLDYPLPYLLFGLVAGLFSGFYRQAAYLGEGAAAARMTATGSAGSNAADTAAGAQPIATPDVANATSAAAGNVAGNTADSMLSGSARLFSGKILAVVIVAFILGIAARLVPHVLSGVLFFGEYAAEAGFSNAWLYSLLYNAGYLLPSGLVCLIAALILLPYLARAVPVRQ